MSLILGWGRSPGGGHGNPLQYSCWENPMDRGAWWATVHRVSKSLTWLKRLSMQTHYMTSKFSAPDCAVGNWAENKDPWVYSFMLFLVVEYFLQVKYYAETWYIKRLKLKTSGWCGGKSREPCLAWYGHSWLGGEGRSQGSNLMVQTLSRARLRGSIKLSSSRARSAPDPDPHGHVVSDKVRKT